jgi:hypothetical protein
MYVSRRHSEIETETEIEIERITTEETRALIVFIPSYMQW